jgi:hypothetical protein
MVAFPGRRQRRRAAIEPVPPHATEGALDSAVQQAITASLSPILKNILTLDSILYIEFCIQNANM